MNEEFTAGQKQQKCKKTKYDAIAVLTFLGEGEEIRQVTNMPRCKLDKMESGSEIKYEVSMSFTRTEASMK